MIIIALLLSAGQCTPPDPIAVERARSAAIVAHDMATVDALYAPDDGERHAGGRRAPMRAWALLSAKFSRYRRAIDPARFCL